MSADAGGHQVTTAPSAIAMFPVGGEHLRGEAIETRLRARRNECRARRVCACGCSIDAPAALPWFTNACAYRSRARDGSARGRAARARHRRGRGRRARRGRRRARGRRSRPRARPATPSPTIGYLFGTTRSVQPGVSGSPGPNRATSGGVSRSLPAQNGQVATLRGSGSECTRKVSGRSARAGARITRSPVSSSTRSCCIEGSG